MLHNPWRDELHGDRRNDSHDGEKDEVELEVHAHGSNQATETLEAVEAWISRNGLLQ